ncbi:hypothetical protein BV22DRAFT_1040991 [Leucogyrophana mollusca]|uniref:Uncharacterized protein n=1 Tax=Leucogyrophana mollusca TaxID=85980 RepID=A0ACB8B3B1_9AGAM|nr:hypothetical protein BV22DRAFT_1040991 [Leucogyrophana mollusca]
MTTATPTAGASTATYLRRNIKCISWWHRRNDPAGSLRSDAQSTSMKLSGSNRTPGERHTTGAVDDVPVHQSPRGQLFSRDLVDNVFGAIITTDLARIVLEGLVKSGTVNLDNVERPHKRRKCDGASGSNLFAASITNAFDVARARACIRSPPLEKQPGDVREEKSWRWPTFPRKPVDEYLLVDFLNLVMEECICIALPHLHNHTQLFRFAAPTNKHHAFPLSYEADDQDLRPDVVLLPITSFNDKGDKKGTRCGTVNEKYLNFTAIRLIGESKSKYHADGVTQAIRYMRGTKRAQPWLRYVLGLAISYHKISFIRGDPAGTEYTDLNLNTSGGSLEFVQLLLGLGLLHDKELLTNPNTDLVEKEVKVKASAIREPLTSRSRATSHASTEPRASTSSCSTPLSSLSRSIQRSPFSNNYSRSSSERNYLVPSSRVLRSSNASTSPKKRSYDQIDDGHPFVRPLAAVSQPESSTIEVTMRARIPAKVYGYDIEGIISNACSIRGRNTLVYAVRKPGKLKAFLALKLSWQLARRTGIEKEVYDLIKGKSINVLASDDVLQGRFSSTRDSTLEKIRGFTKEQYTSLGLEERILNASAVDLKRPVRFFWSIHDFVMGVRGALLGHQWLVGQGFLHRDISENNIVLALRPTEPQRGYLIDFDMAVHYKEDGGAQGDQATLEARIEAIRQEIKKGVEEQKLDHDKCAERRTGTTPYMSLNVLTGGHIHCPADDVESFLYVLLLFPFSYRHSLEREELILADERGFAHIIASGRPVHLAQWPAFLLAFSEGTFSSIEGAKRNMFARPLKFLRDAHRELMMRFANKELITAYNVLLFDALAKFITVPDEQGQAQHRSATHDELVGALDEWLKEYLSDEYLEKLSDYNKCPFKDAQGRYMV